MAGHSQYANIKHRKAAVDSKRSKLWSKLAKAIIVAAKLGGGDPDGNVRLRTAILDAKAVSMPKDNIERAIKKGTGELEGGGELEELLYEGYGPGGVAVMLEITTDNRNRTASEVRFIFDKNGGELGKTNCVAYMFERKGILVVNETACDLEKLMEVVLEAGADDIAELGGQFEITCRPESYLAVAEALEASQIPTEHKAVSRVPSSTVAVDDEVAQAVMKLLELLEDHDDVQSVSTNVQFTDEQLAAVG